MAGSIKRQDAMAVLTNALHGYESDEIYEKSVKALEEIPAFENAKSWMGAEALKRQRWVPVSERLPEKGMPLPEPPEEENR